MVGKVGNSAQRAPGALLKAPEDASTPPRRRKTRCRRRARTRWPAIPGRAAGRRGRTPAGNRPEPALSQRAEVDEGDRPQGARAGAGAGAPALPLPFLADRRPAEAVQFDPKRRPARGLSTTRGVGSRPGGGALPCPAQLPAGTAGSLAPVSRSPATGRPAR